MGSTASFPSAPALTAFPLPYHRTSHAVASVQGLLWTQPSASAFWEGRGRGLSELQAWEGPQAAERISPQSWVRDCHRVLGRGLVQCPQKMKVKGCRHGKRRGMSASFYKTGTFPGFQRSRCQGAWGFCNFPTGCLQVSLPAWPKLKPGSYSPWHL